MVSKALGRILVASLLLLTAGCGPESKPTDKPSGGNANAKGNPQDEIDKKVKENNQRLNQLAE